MYTAKGLVEKNNNIINDYISLVRSQACLLHRKVNNHIELDDLIQSGMIGLLDALDKYKDDRGAQFETYARTRIYGAMVDDLRKMDVMGQDDRSLLKKIEKVQYELEKDGQKTNSEIIAKQLNISIKKYQEMIQLKLSTNILNNNDDSIKYLTDNVVDERQNIEMTIIKNQLKSLLAKEIETLVEREQQIMSLYYQEEFTFKEIGHILELTEARVSQLHNQIILKLKTSMKKYN